jgi:hypothetical protein
MFMVACGDDGAPMESGTESTTDSPTSSSSMSSSMSATTMMSTSTTTTPDTDTDTTTTGDTETSSGSESESGGTSSGSSSSSGSDSGSDSGSSSSSSTGETTGGVVPDVSGDFLLAAALIVDPMHPFQWTVEVVFTATDDGGGTMDLVLQPLALDIGETTEPRTAFGGTLEYDDVVVSPDGTFELDLGELQLEGETNPITGSDIVATAQIEGEVVDADNMCGDLSGAVTSPLMLDLAGSTFAMTRIEAPDPDSLPLVFPTSCP